MTMASKTGRCDDCGKPLSRVTLWVHPEVLEPYQDKDAYGGAMRLIGSNREERMEWALRKFIIDRLERSKEMFDDAY